MSDLHGPPAGPAPVFRTVGDQQEIDDAATVLAAFDGSLWSVAADDPVIERLQDPFDGLAHAELLAGGLTA